MVSLPVAIQIALLAFTMTFTPGPANIILMGMASRYGFKRTVPFLIGVITGFAILGAVLALGLFQVIQAIPDFLFWCKLLGSVYLLYLVYKIANTSALAKGKDIPPGFHMGLLVHPLNPKAWVMLGMAYSGFVSEAGHAGEFFAVWIIFVLVGIFSNSAWCYGGDFFRRILNTTKRVTIFNRVMALALLFMIIWMWL